MRKLLPKKQDDKSGSHYHFPLCNLLNKNSCINLFLFFIFIIGALQTSAQRTEVSGIVTDAITKEPLAGASVKIKNSTTVVTTDATGKFTITTTDLNGILVFTYVGFTSQELPLNGRKNVNMQLASESEALKSIIVVGYGTLDKREVTSAISHVSGDELATVASNDPLMKLQGKVPGLTIENTAATNPNSTARIQLRGVTTRSAATSPLIVIDGVPGGNLETINENDIASIDVLKDGAASAIYGTRASNGVILITTKKGSTGPGKLTYTGFASFDLPTRTLKSLTAAEFKAQKRGTDFGANTDWLKLISNDYAFTQKHTLSFTGGGENTSYRASLDYQDASGLDITSRRQQYGGRLSVNHNAKNGLYNILLNVAPRFAKGITSNSSVFNEALLLNPTVPVFNPANPNLYSSFGGYDEYNPVEQLKLQQTGMEQKYLDWNATFKLNFLPQLNTQVQVAQVSRDNFDYSFSPSNMTTQVIAGTQGTASRAYNKSDMYSFEWLANYSLNVKKHALKLLGVYSYQYFTNSRLNAGNSNFSTNAITYNNLNNGTYNMVAGRNGFDTYKEDSRLISFRGRLNYAFDNKYLFSASLTRDGSSKFGENNKWGYFPGVSAGWRLDAEPFMQGISWINELKIRADYGETGNQDAISNYQSLALYQGYGQYQYNGTYMQVWGPASNANTDLRWERLKNWNLGLDFSFFNSTLNGTINYYSRRAIDLLGSYNAPLPPNIALTTIANVGNMKSSGIEFEFDVKVINKKNFTYNISLNGATQNSVFVSFSNDLYKGQTFVDQVNMPAPGSPGTAQRLQEGKRLGMFYFWKYAGVDKDGNFLIYDKKGAAVPAAQATQDDKQFVGNGQPKFTGGMTHIFRYNKWDASVSFRGVFGWDIFNVHQFYYGLQSAAYNSNVLPSSYGKNATIKGLPLLTDYFLEKGDFLKLDVVTIGRTIKTRYFQSVRLYASSRNLVTFTGFKGADPDVYPINGQNPGILNASNTGTKAYYPTTTQLLIGAQVNF